MILASSSPLHEDMSGKSDKTLQDNDKAYKTMLTCVSRNSGKETGFLYIITRAEDLSIVP